MSNSEQDNFYGLLDKLLTYGREYSEDVLLSVSDVPHTRYVGTFMHGELNGIFIPEGESISSTWEHPRHIDLKADIVIAEPSNTRPFQPCLAAHQIATCLCMADKVPDDRIVVCADARVVQDFPGLVDIPEIRVLYDESGESGVNCVYSATDLSFDKKGSLVWHGAPPDRVVEFCCSRNEKARSENIADEIKLAFGDIANLPSRNSGAELPVFYGNALIDEARDLVEATSFGWLSADIDNGSLPGLSYIMKTINDQAAEWMLDNVVFDQRENLDAKDSQEEDAKLVEQIRAIANIWRSSLLNYGASLGIGQRIDIAAIQKFGSLIGVDSMIDAYFGGVPLADILA